MNYNINLKTGEYYASGPFPTGIPSDPVLTALGQTQSKELALHLSQITPPIDEIYSSPYYRCIQTLLPTTTKLFAEGRAGGKVKIEAGFSEFHGRAWFKHPKPAAIKELDEEHFPELLDTAYESISGADVYGETIDQLHDRLAYTLHKVIEACDARTDGPRTILICTHAACMIGMGRALTGVMPEDFTEDDFQCFTAGVSKFKRRRLGKSKEDIPVWDGKVAEDVPVIGWRGDGVQGGWDCQENSDCSWLSSGPERGW